MFFVFSILLCDLNSNLWLTTDTYELKKVQLLDASETPSTEVYIDPVYKGRKHVRPEAFSGNSKQAGIMARLFWVGGTSLSLFLE